MSMKDILGGINILMKHYNNPDGYHMDAEHEMIYMGNTDNPLSEEEFKQMQEFGWYQDDLHDEDVYDPDEPWKRFV